MPFNSAICMLNSKYIHCGLAPWCLYASCKSLCEDAEISIIEGTVNEKEDDLLRRILKEKYDLLTFSCYIWNIEKTLYLCREIKRLSPSTAILLGGPEVSFCSEKILKENPFIDFVLSGEGEKALPQIINCLKENIPPFNVRGISYRRDTVIIKNPEEILSLSSLPSPYSEEFFHSIGSRIAYIESSRGCPFKCAFCLSGESKSLRFFPMERVKSDILKLSSYGVKTIKFVDRTFNCHKGRCEEILTFIGENYGKAIPEGTCFHFEIAADLLTESTLNIIKKLPLGAVQFEIGIQSFNPDTLKAIGRNNNLDMIITNTKKLLSFSNCHIHIDLIAGLPKEDFQSFISDFNKAYFIKADMLQLGFLKLLYGSEMKNNPKSYPMEYSTKPPYEVISTPYISYEELKMLHIAENELERLYNSHRFPRTLDYVLKVSELTPFELFYGSGIHITSESIPLDQYLCKAYEYFVALPNVEPTVLRDKMLTDRIATNNSDVIPKCLQIKDENLGKIKARLRKKFSCEKLSVGILYTENRIICCDYKKKNPVSSEYEIKYIKGLH